ncbi:MAG: SpoIIE family protein phosphatase [Candidatus Omnitrophica bacterium]|nr:SpoIIE family protein phosphatase [Candidatus Omnitrophota bacterium]
MSNLFFKFFILVFLCLALPSFSKKSAAQILLINIESDTVIQPSWKERRALAEIIEKLAVAKPRAIIVTYPCVGYTSIGADQALIKAVKDAGCVYFSLPLWDAMYAYAAGIGHVQLRQRKNTVSILSSIIYEEKLFPALSVLLNEEISGRKIDSDFYFKRKPGIKFEEYTSDKIASLKADAFKDKICFIGERESNCLQAEAFYALASEEAVAISRNIFLYYLVFAALVSGLLAAGFLLVKKAFKKDKLPLKKGRLNFGKAMVLSKNRQRSIFDFRVWPDGDIWLWMADSNPNNGRRVGEEISKFFYSFKEPLGAREALIRLNNHLERAGGSSFINLILLNIDPRGCVINFSNAGFEPPLIFRNSTKEFNEFKHSTHPLGIGKSIDFDEQKITLDKSDILFLFNSGIVKSRDTDGRFIAPEQLKYMITQNSSLPAQKLSGKILRVILDFNASRPEQDMIFLAIKAN